MLYYVYVEGQAVGPLPLEGLKPLVETGKVTGDTLTWTEALERWQSARTLAALTAAFPALATVPRKPAKPRAAAAPSDSLASFGARFAAGGIDVLLLGLPLGLAALILGAPQPGQSRSLFLPGIGVMDWLFLLLSAAYFIGFMSKAGGGRTPGYRLLGLRLVARETRAAPAFGAVLLWAVVNSVNAVGFLWYFFTAERRMLHNIVSDTLVLKVK